MLKPGAKEVLTLKIDEKCLKSYDEYNAQWIIEAGQIRFYLGDDVAHAVFIDTLLSAKTKVIAQVKNRLLPPLQFDELSVRNMKNTWPTGKYTRAFIAEETDGKLPYKKEKTEAVAAVGAESVTQADKNGSVWTFAEVLQSPQLLETFVAQMDDRMLARISCGGATGWGIEDTGFAGMLYHDGVLKDYQLPNCLFADGNNGVNMFEPNIGFPVSNVVCATFNEKLAYKAGCCIAREAKDMDISCLLAPALNIQRNPLCGRHSEYFSEDPLLAGHMAGWQCKGFEDTGVSGCMKHFIANNAETMRNCNHSIMSERTAREIYLRAFEFAMDIHMPDTVMTGYNAVNGAWCSQNEELLRGILREEFGFNGYVMTDWNGYGDGDLAELLTAGINWIAPGSEDDSFIEPLTEAIHSGRLDRGLLRRNVTEMLAVIMRRVSEKGR